MHWESHENCVAVCCRTPGQFDQSHAKRRCKYAAVFGWWSANICEENS